MTLPSAAALLLALGDALDQLALCGQGTPRDTLARLRRAYRLAHHGDEEARATLPQAVRTALGALDQCGLGSCRKTADTLRR